MRPLENSYLESPSLKNLPVESPPVEGPPVEGPPAENPPARRDEELAAEAEAMSRFGVAAELIAARARLTLPELRRLYQADLDRGQAEAALAIGQALFEKAVGGDLAALVFWAKTRLGWKESQRTEAPERPAKLLVYRLPDNGRQGQGQGKALDPGCSASYP
ncbi:MAG: hypothetical protein LBS31_05125 [Candidatus Adiutrix sp.]|jgi:hypothetical protein|nr:hypothetical protein [Candidatus Adiutrix sp.]